MNFSCSSKGALAGIKDPGPVEDAITCGDLSTAKKLLGITESETESNTKSESKIEFGEQTKLSYCTLLHPLCERHQLLQEQPPFPLLLRDIGI